MDWSQSLNAPPYFDGSNYAFWKVHIRVFLCAIDKSVWDSVKNGYVRPTTAKSKWDKATLALANANSKAINAVFCGVSIDEFHRISHVKTAKEAWTILETTYKGTKKVKDTKLQMLTTRFEELKMNDNESFNSFYGKLNEIMIAKLNLSEKIKDAKVNYRAKVTAIKESKDLNEIKIQELIGSLQTYELGLPSHEPSKSLALKTINERMDDSSEEDDDVEKEVAFLVKNFQNFLKMKNSGKSFSKGKFSSSKGGIVCYECNGHGHIKKECPNYLKGKGKVFAITLSNSESSNSDAEEECESDENYRAFMAITSIDSRDELSNLVNELGEHSEGEEVEESKVEESKDEDVCQNEGENNL
ncbi:hypothetical protein ACB092_04G052500 [Castanea dentata]